MKCNLPPRDPGFLKYQVAELSGYMSKLALKFSAITMKLTRRGRLTHRVCFSINLDRILAASWFDIHSIHDAYDINMLSFDNYTVSSATKTFI